MKGVRIDKPIDWSRLVCIECSSSPDYVGVNSQNDVFYICNDCKMEYYEATL